MQQIKNYFRDITPLFAFIKIYSRRTVILTYPFVLRTVPFPFVRPCTVPLQSRLFSVNDNGTENGRTGTERFAERTGMLK